ncbi:MAG TPA: hypothetical protein VKK81_05965 [Candidatus Binatia bacterium]|nr:hypothetical protein [Candidatus Binatia bacterium]
MQVAFASPTLTASMPVEGFEVKLTQVLLQPTTASQTSTAAQTTPDTKTVIALGGRITGPH